MIKNSSSGSNNNRNRSSSLSHVVVVKKKKFNFKKTTDTEENKDLSLEDDKDNDINKVDNIEQNNTLENDYILDDSSQVKTEGSRIRNLDEDSAEESVVAKESKASNEIVDDESQQSDDNNVEDQDKVKDKPSDTNLLKDNISLKKTTSPKKKNKNFLNDITIVSHSKEKKYNSSSEASLFLNKPKYDDNKKNKNFYDDEEVEKERLRSIASIKRARAKMKRALEGQNSTSATEEKKGKEIIIPEIITVQELANRMAVRSADVVKELMKMGMMITATKPIDADTAELLVTEFGYIPNRVLDSDIEKKLEDLEKNNPKKQEYRFPVVSVMGHVDHGKTSLLDAIRDSDVVSSESGGITQHIGASVIKVDDKHSITFLDTPGHEAFTAMRLRGAHATDMVILVVAADDGVKAQTIEAINHAKAAKIPIIVAINKIDKEGSNPKRVIDELLEHGVIVESLGGECLCVELSAAKKQNLDKLLSAILLQSELLELKANRDCAATGVVIEGKVDKSKGAIATFLIQAGTLKIGDVVVASTTYGKVRLMIGSRGEKLEKACPSEPAEILGLDNVPEAGEKFYVVESEKVARDIIEYRIKKRRDVHAAKKSKKTLEDIFSHMTDEKRVQLPLIIKADVKGSIEAISESLEKLSNDAVKINIIHAAVGGISESDAVLAQASNAVVIGFNVRVSNNIKESSLKDVDIRYFSIIYDVIDSISAVTHGLLKPIEKEVELGKGEIRQVFNISKAGNVAGSYILSGVAKRSGKCRIIRDSVVIADTSIKALKRYKDDVKEVNTGSECGITFDNYTDFKEGDQLEFYEVVEKKHDK